MQFETAAQTSHTPPDVETREALSELLCAFEQFKQANDERLEEVEKKQVADVLIEDKVDRINARTSELNHRVTRPHLDDADAPP